MSKSINILFYKRGLGGNLIKFLLSLDKSTFPYYPKNVEFDNTKPRIEYLSFDNIKWKYGSWLQFHLSYQGTSASQYGESKDFEEFVESNYNNLTIYGHHIDISRFIKHYETDLKQHTVNYLTIKNTEKFDYVLDDFAIDNGTWVKNYPGSDEGLLDLDTKYNPYIINLDNIYLGTETFIEEYKRLNDYLQLPYHIEDALKIYKGWVKSRGIGRYEFFKG